MQNIFCAVPCMLQKLSLTSSFMDYSGLLENSVDDVNFSHLKSLSMQSVSNFSSFNRILKNDSLVNHLEALDISNSDGDGEGFTETLR